MFKKMSVVICGLAVMLMTAGPATAQGDAVADAATTAAVKSKLLADTKVGGLKIDVDTKDNVVTLTGRVRSAAERAEALRLARTTTGVKSVVDKLTIAPVATTGRTDKDDKLKIEIKDDTKESAAKVKEATKKGAEKTGDAAKKAGEKTKDVTQDAAGKTKDAAVKGKDVTADASITAAVKTKLLGDTAVRGLKIDVDTKDNVVTLTGTVRSAAEKAEAIRLAKTTTGVKSVVDKLTIQP